VPGIAADNYIDVGLIENLYRYLILQKPALPSLATSALGQKCHSMKLGFVRGKTSISTCELSIRVCAAFGDDGTPLVGFLLKKLLEPSRLQQFLGGRLSAELVKPSHNIRIRERGFHR
jgi:hypothetical protein